MLGAIPQHHVLGSLPIACIANLSAFAKRHAVEIHYGIGTSHDGQGFATEAAAAVTYWLLSSPPIQRVWTAVDVELVASRRVLEKLGFHCEGILRAWAVLPAFGACSHVMLYPTLGLINSLRYPNNMIQKFSVLDLTHNELQSSITGEKYSLSAVLTDKFELKDLFVHHEIVPPGRRSSGTHFHNRREEIVFILQGQITTWLCGKEVVLKSGEFTAFPPGRSNAHYLKNETDTETHVLVIASNPSDDEVEYVLS